MEVEKSACPIVLGQISTIYIDIDIVIIKDNT